MATAELYPKFSLVGSIGLNALDLTNLFSASSQAFSIGPSVSRRLFDAGAIRKKIEVQSEGTVTSNVVRLYKALGGGWSSAAAKNE